MLPLVGVADRGYRLFFIVVTCVTCKEDLLKNQVETGIKTLF